MRFFYVTLVAAVTLLASANAVSTKQNQISETSPEIVARSLAAAQDDAAVKRNLRKYVEEDDLDSLDSLDSFDETEERAKVINVKQLKQLAKTKNAHLPVNFAKLNFKMQMNTVKTWAKQNMNLKQFATKLGLKSVNDVGNKNYPVFKMFEARFT
ncbi:hypothetical protein KRP22_008581 [Phytophthora ramorum]|uniref:uncharacterized protein n=1 Tax=Phytophthora ramorum TaxID=164328 RepID=UPI003099C924|nr:hypothetical protein KRP23_2720 [Phytophthora ramorum]KAH7501940.1 hypothetical protein KRP22_7414 [Phytophthora ramorum]